MFWQQFVRKIKSWDVAVFFCGSVSHHKCTSSHWVVTMHQPLLFYKLIMHNRITVFLTAKAQTFSEWAETIGSLNLNAYCWHRGQLMNSMQRQGDISVAGRLLWHFESFDSLQELQAVTWCTQKQFELKSLPCKWKVCDAQLILLENCSEYWPLTRQGQKANP